MLTLFHAPQTRSTRIIWLLEELGAPYELRRVGIRYGDGTGPGPDAQNPHPDGKVPALVHGGQLVTESAAVALYLCDLHPGSRLGRALDDPERGAFLSWLVWTECEFGPALYGAAVGMAPQPGAVDAVFRRLSAALERGPYLMGDTFSAVDVMIGSGLAWMRHVLPASESIDAYARRITERPAWRATLERDGVR